MGKPETSKQGNSRLTGEGQIDRRATMVETADQKKKESQKKTLKHAIVK